MSYTAAKKILSLISDNPSDSFDATGKIVKKLDSLPSVEKDIRSLVKDVDWTNTPKTFCHGDLTFENMIVSNGKLYLIDFLDSFIETGLVDMSKLIFDIRYFWSHRKYDKKFQSIVRNIFFEENIRKLSTYNDHKNKINCLVIMSILRIIPYVPEHNISLRNYLNGCLKDATRTKK